MTARGGRRRLRDVVGIPVVPPGGATAAFTLARAGLRRAHRATAPPPVQILEALFGVLDHRVLVALCEAGVPDALDGPIDPAVLARRVGADAPALERLLRYGHTRGWVRLDRRGRVRPTRVTRFLATSHPGGWRGWVDFAGGAEIGAATGALAIDGADAFATANGRPFFEWMADHPDRWRDFDRAMQAGARVHGHALAAALDWSGVTTVCDVGGGTGELLATVLDLVPGLVSGTVFDLPQVVGRAVAHPRLIAEPGDAFVSVPGGFGAYLLVNVLHDWHDVDATRILRSVWDAAPSGARVVVVDHERRPVPRDDLAIAVDVLMAVLTNGGRERTTAEFVALASGVGFTQAGSHTLASGDRAHVFRRP